MDCARRNSWRVHLGHGFDSRRLHQLFHPYGRKGDELVKRVLSVVTLSIFMGIFGFALNVTFNPNNTVPPNAPFSVEVSAQIDNLSEIVITFNGTSKRSSEAPTIFEFYAPSLPKSSSFECFPLIVKAFYRNGNVKTQKYTVCVCKDAKTVVRVQPLMMLAPNGSFSGNAKFKIHVYAGAKVKELEFYEDSKQIKIWEFSAQSPFSTVLTVNIPTTNLKSGQIIFSLAEKQTTGEKSILWNNAYILNNIHPFVAWNKFLYCPAATRITFNITANSTFSGIKWVKVNGNIAERVGEKSYEACLISPDKTGKWHLKIEALDNAGNSFVTTPTIFVDGEKPLLELKNDADYVQNGKTITFWKKHAPLHITVSASSLSEIFRKMSFTVNGKKVALCSTTLIFSKPGTYFLKASVEDEINHSRVSTTLKFVVKFDDLAPTVENIVFSPSGLKNEEGYNVIAPVSTLEVTITASDGTGVGVQNISVTPRAKGEGNTRTFYVPNLKDGPNTYPLTITLKDKVGNSTTITKKLKIFVDASVPTLTMTPIYDEKGGDFYWNKSSFKLMITSRTQGGIAPRLEVYVNGEKVEDEITSAYILKIDKEGNYKIKVVSTNRINGKKATRVETYLVRFDTEPPTIDAVSVPATAGPNQKVEVEIKARDTGIGIKGVYVNGKAAKLREGSYVAYIKTPNWKESKSWTLNVKAKDKLGNITTKEKRIFIDTNPPSVKVEVIPGQYYKDGIYWSGKTPFAIVVKSKTDSGVAPILKCEFNGNSMPEDVYYIGKNTSGILNVTAINPVNGKKNSFSKSYVFKFDNSAPTISNVTFNATNAPGNKLVVKLVTRDEGYGEVRYVEINGIFMRKEGETWSATLTLPDKEKSGEFPLNIEAFDVFGNESVKTSYAYIDASRPKITLYLRSKDGEERITRNSVFFFQEAPRLYYVVTTAGGAKSKAEMYIDCKTTNNGTKIEGIHFVRITAKDLVNGKKSVLEEGLCVVVDQTKPTVELNVPKVMNLKKVNVSLNVYDKHLRYASFTLKEGVKILYSEILLSNGEKSISLMPYLKGINGKRLEFTLKAVDMAGNTAKTSAYATVDTVPPYVKEIKFNDKKGILTVIMSEKVRSHGTPSLVLIGSEKEKLIGKCQAINGNELVFTFENGKPKSDDTYEVEMKNVTDLCGNPIENNGVERTFK